MTYPSMYGWPEVPQPVAGCDRCVTLHRDRKVAIRRGDGSAESDFNVLIRRHHAGDHR